jgi:uncharacterized membrane protein
MLSALMPFLLLFMLVVRFNPSNPSTVFGMAMVLAAMISGLALYAGAPVLHAAGFCGVVMVELGWRAGHGSVHSPALALAWHLGVYAAFALYPFVVGRRERDAMAWAVGAVGALVHFGLAYSLALGAHWLQWPAAQGTPYAVHHSLGLIPGAFGVVSLALTLWASAVLRKDAPERIPALSWLGGATLFFFTALLPVQFSKEWLTVGWAFEGAALCWLFRRLPHPGLKHVGFGLLVAAFVRLALNPEVLDYHQRSGTPIFNWMLYTYGSVAIAHFVAARLLASPRREVLGFDAPPVLQLMGTVLAFLLLNLEIADYFSTGPTLLIDFNHNVPRDMATTVGWALFALVLLMVGILREVRGARWSGLGLLGVAIAKLFLFDLANLGQLYRVGALASVALIASVSSVLYQRFLASDRENR